MQLKLEGKTAFVSGSTSGIGLATATALAKEGVKVILNGRNEKALELALQKMKSLFPNSDIEGLIADFSNAQQIETLCTQLPQIDILVNNVGIFRSMSFKETTDEDWYQHLEVNVMSGVRLSRFCLPKMLTQGWGRILFISSECATLVPTDMIAYSTTKAALHALSRGLAQMTVGSGVTVNTIQPGSTLSGGAENFLQNVAQQQGKTKTEVESDFFKQVRTSSLLQRFATVEEVANTITYYCSPLAAATNGAVIKVDGGSVGGIV